MENFLMIFALLAIATPVLLPELRKANNRVIGKFNHGMKELDMACGYLIAREERRYYVKTHESTLPDYPKILKSLRQKEQKSFIELMESGSTFFVKPKYKEFVREKLFHMLDNLCDPNDRSRIENLLSQ